MDGIGTLDDAFGCWEEDEKGLGLIGLVLAKQRGCIASAKVCRHG
jgi:hypothetical protein